VQDIHHPCRWHRFQSVHQSQLQGGHVAGAGERRKEVGHVVPGEELFVDVDGADVREDLLAHLHPEPEPQNGGVKGAMDHRRGFGECEDVPEVQGAHASCVGPESDIEVALGRDEIFGYALGSPSERTHNKHQFTHYSP
jgi:hypothetical protein